jgi:hypothetical protein
MAGISKTVTQIKPITQAWIGKIKYKKNRQKTFLELDNRNYYLKNEANTRDWNLYGQRFLVFSEYISGKTY